MTKRGSGMAAVSLALMALVACGEQGAAVPAGPATASDAAAPASVPAGSGPGVRPESRAFSEWLGTCDNGNGCVAYTGTDEGGWLMVRQAAGPDARPDIRIGVSAFSRGDSVASVRLTIDGQNQMLTATPDGSLSHAVPADQVGTVLARLASARTLMIDQGDTVTRLPTAGASAAFLWIDEKQGRLGTTTALIRRGDRPATVVPAAPVLPGVTAAAIVDQGALAGAGHPGARGAGGELTLPAALEALPAVRQCREDTGYSPDLQKAVLAARLSAGTELWGVPCDAGAYNAMYDLYLTGPDGTNPVKATFPGWEPREISEGDIAGDGLVNPVFDARTNTLRHFVKARGIGDCGIDQTWAWTGKAFVLTRETSMGQCWGMISHLWPTTWRTR